MKKYDFKKIEKKWREKWLADKTYEPDLDSVKKPARPVGGPFYNLMMFPYPSAEGLHVGNMYAFVGADIYGRKKRMEGFDVFEPIGLDGFGIHSENYAIKIGKHPKEHAANSERNFYRQLSEIGNGYAWDEKLETYDPEYYKWTQWLFVQMFKAGLAYRKKATVNWCPKCSTVLADEQVVGGEPARPDEPGRSGGCERCQTKVIKKDLEQWFFKITNYAERLLENLDGPAGTNFLILHGYTGRASKNFIPWLKNELENAGYPVQAPELPNTDDPKEVEQVSHVFKNCSIDENTIIIGHSLGAIVAMKVLERYKKPIQGLVLVAPAMDPDFIEANEKPFWKNFEWDVDYEVLKYLAKKRTVLSDIKENKRTNYLEELAKKIDAQLVTGYAKREHFCAEKEPIILENVLPGLDWSEKIKIAQRNWIGKSEGVEIVFSLVDISGQADGNHKLKIFTTRPDTIFGATFMVISPERAKLWLDIGWQASEEVKKYIVGALARRWTSSDLKTGVFSGVSAINPANKEKIPVWISDYVLADYGTGAIMAVPAHDERDMEFAKKFGLPISNAPLVSFDEAIQKVGGVRKTQYRLRDWLISRQRYWGPPIPMIWCDLCAKWMPEREENLPVLLPDVKDFRPTGTDKSPLANFPEFYETKCPECGGPARRETDVSDTFLDSAWYYMRYLDPKNEKEFASQKRLNNWLPVHMYIGGAEHAVLHLLYVRFVSMALHDMGKADFAKDAGGEPIKCFRAHGLLIKDGAKISKSRGNIVNPDDYLTAYGADVLRMYLMFLGPFDQGGDFRDDGIRGLTRFLGRVWEYYEKRSDLTDKRSDPSGVTKKLAHKTVKKVGEDIERLQYNTAISALMILLTQMEKVPDAFADAVFLLMLAPFAPHLTEEIFEMRGSHETIHKAPWPQYDTAMIQDETFELVIQVNGKVRDTVGVPMDISESDAHALALTRDKVKIALGNTTPKKTIFVPKKLINFVV